MRAENAGKIVSILRGNQLLKVRTTLKSEARDYASVYGEEMLPPRPTPKMEDHLLSAVRDSLFNIFADTLHIGGRSSATRGRATGTGGGHL